MSLNVLNVMKLGRQWIVNINDNDLPVRLLLVEQGHRTENLDALDLASMSDIFSNLTDVERIVVAMVFGVFVKDVGVFPCLQKSG